jgi:hypothetical protein
MRCMGTQLALPVPTPQPRPSLGVHSEASPLDLATLFLQPRHEDKNNAVALQVVGYRVAELFCAVCKIPADPTCPRCQAPGKSWQCIECAGLKRLAVTTSAATEDWACSNCGAIDHATRDTHQQVQHHQQIRLPLQHPAVHAMATAALKLPRGGWARAAHDGSTIHTSSQSSLRRVLKRAKPKPQLHGTTYRKAREEDLAIQLPIITIQNNPAAATHNLGEATARTAGTLLQNLTHHRRAGTNGQPRPSPPQAARTSGALSALRR